MPASDRTPTAAYVCTCGPNEYCAADDCHGARGRRLVLTIEFPGFYVEDVAQDEEQVEESMHLASDDVIVVFSGHEGDSPGTVLRSLEGRIREFGVRDA